MNAKLLLKMLFVIVILLLLVIMGMHNRGVVRFALPPLVSEPVSQPAAIMYFAFFAVGLISGTVLTAGGKKGSSSSSKAAKSSK